MQNYYEIVTYIMSAILGLCVGSFLNVVIYRVPKGMSLATPSSHCPKCKYVLKWYDNIPILSYIMLRGKCRKCGEKIPLRYTLTEVANMLLWIISAFLFFEKSIPLMVIAALASSIMLCVFFIDIEHKLVFDRFVIMLSVLGITAMFFDPYYGWMSHLIGGIVGFVSFYSIAAIFAKLKNKECLGGGDIKLTAACGLLLGWQRLLLSVLIATVSASIVLVILSKKAEDEEKEYPFAPFLTAAFAISMFFGHGIITAYLSLLVL